MAAIRFPSFVRLETLQSLKPSSLALLLNPRRDYLALRGVSIDALDLDALIDVITNPELDTPPEFIEDFDLLDLITGVQSLLWFEEDYAAVLAELREPDDSPADVAVKILRRAPHAAWREFDRRALQCKRSFSVFAVADGLPEMPCDGERTGELEDTMGAWFERNARTKWCRVRAIVTEHGISFIVRHADVLNRMGVVDDNGAAQTIFRPERLDLVHYRRHSRRWLISTRGNALVGQYQREFGRLFHGSMGALSPARRFSLDPLKAGSKCLDCEQGGAINYVVLKSASVEYPDGQRILVKHGNIFAFLQTALAAGAKIYEATLALKVSGRRAHAVVKINLDKESLQGAADIPAVEAWLEAAKFILPSEPQELLASA